MAVKAVQSGQNWAIDSLTSPAFAETSVTSQAAVSTTLDGDSLEISSPGTNNRAALARDTASINDAIEAVHVAAQSVSSMAQYVEGISGLAEIASSQSITPRQTAILEIEGVELRQAIAQKAQAETSLGLKPLGGDPIRVELERTLAPVLELIFPDERRTTLGIDGVSFSSKEMILATATKIEVARQRLRELRGAVEDGLEQLSTLAQSYLRSSVGDVEKALLLGWDIKGSIAANSDVATGSHMTAERDFTQLLDSTSLPVTPAGIKRFS